MIIYFHGFNSSGQSAKGQYLKQALANILVQTPSYSWQPEVAISELESVIEKHKSDSIMLVGSSLGGFYAQYLARKYQCKLVLINPALDPVAVLKPYIGENRNYYTYKKYIFTQQDLISLKKYYITTPCTHRNNNPVPTLLLADAGDEVIDQKFSVRQYADCAKVIIYPDGDHAFQHMAEAVIEIDKFYRQQFI